MPENDYVYVGGPELFVSVPAVLLDQMAYMDDVSLRLILAFYLAEHQMGQGVFLTLAELAKSIGRPERLTLAALSRLQAEGAVEAKGKVWCLIPFIVPADPASEP